MGLREMLILPSQKNMETCLKHDMRTEYVHSLSWESVFMHLDTGGKINILSIN
jgi:hypothetical protein